MITDQNNSHIERWLERLNFHFENVVLFLTSETNAKDLSNIIRLDFDPKDTVIISGPIEKVSINIGLEEFSHYLLSFGYDIQNHLDELKPFMKGLSSNKSGGFIVDNAINSAILKDIGIPEESVFQIPWGVKTNWLEEFKENTYKKDSFAFISPRSHEQIYRIDTVLTLFEKFYRKNSENILYLLGDGSLNKEILKLVSESQFATNVKFLGRVTEDRYHQLLLDSDFYLSASEVDGSSVSLLQAMGLGVIPIVSDIPANDQWVRRCNTGFIFDRTDLATVVEQVWAKLKSGGLPELSTNARTLILRDACWEKNFQNLIGFLKETFQDYFFLIRYCLVRFTS